MLLAEISQITCFYSRFDCGGRSILFNVVAIVISKVLFAKFLSKVCVAFRFLILRNVEAFGVRWFAFLSDRNFRKFQKCFNFLLYILSNQT